MTPKSHSGLFLRCAASRGWLVLLGAVLACGTGLASGQEAGDASQAAPSEHHATAANPEAKARAEEKAQGSYSYGLLMAGQLHELGLTTTDVDLAKLMQGVRAGLSGKAEPQQEDQQRARAYVTSVRQSIARRNEAAAQKFFDQNATQPGVQTLPSGLQYKVITEGSGPSPAPTDEVTVNYRGTFLDGTEFDSSYKRGQPAVFIPNGVIQGWRQALPMMKAGAKWELYIPAKLAYGDDSRPPIPPGSLLKFEVELISFRAPPPRPAPPTAPPRSP